MEKQTQKIDMWTRAGERKERARWMERGAWKHNTTIHKIDRQWKFAVGLRQLELRLCNNLEKGGSWREAQEGGGICTKWSAVKSLSRVWLFATPWTVACQAPQSWDFPGKSTGVGCHFLLQDVCIPMGNLCCCMAETKPILKSNYLSTKNE